MVYDLLGWMVRRSLLLETLIRKVSKFGQGILEKIYLSSRREGKIFSFIVFLSLVNHSNVSFEIILRSKGLFSKFADGFHVRLMR